MGWLQLGYVYLLTKRLAWVLGFYTLGRILFYTFNLEQFSEVTPTGLFHYLCCGIRFDVAAICYTNALVILLHLLPVPFRSARWYQRIVWMLFIVINSLALLSQVIDLEYFQYQQRRTTFGIFLIGGDILTLLPSYLVDYWYLLLLWLAQVLLLTWLYRPEAVPQVPKWNYPVQVLILMVGLALTFLGLRGGWQGRPLLPVNAQAYASLEETPLVTNTPFEIIHSFQKLHLRELGLMSLEKAQKIYPVKEKIPQQSTKPGTNYMVIVLESFSREHIGAISGRTTSYTPFLDSLALQGVNFTNAYANGKTSMDGILAITTGIPDMMEESFMISPYQNNRLNSIPQVLGDNYYSAFFHGANNGSFGFNLFANAIGFDAYFGLNEYPDPSDHDGSWGIWDEPFFQYTIQQLDQAPKPFFALLFSLSSHQPFDLPKQYVDKFKGGPLPIQRTIQYTDYALRQFFKTAATKPWFSNTKFIITADHTSQVELKSSYSRTGLFAIPLIIYDPSDTSSQGLTYDHPVQQIDIMRMILNESGPPGKAYMSFGKNELGADSKPGLAFHHFHNYYHLIDSEYILMFNGKNKVGLFNYRTDTLQQKNLLKQLPERSGLLEQQLMAILEQFHYRMIHNRLSLSEGNIDP